LNVVVDFSKVHREARDVAREEEENTRSLLWQRLSVKALEDPEFKKRLISEPKEVVELEAQRLKDDAGNPVAVPPNVVRDTAERARITVSSAVGEIDLTQVTDLVFGTIRDVRTSFSLTLVLCQVLFYAGLVMVAGAFVFAFIGGKEWMSVLFGASGVASILISSFVLGPLDRIRDAAGNLIQLQMAYLSYYNQLYLLGGGRKLSRDEAFLYAKEIDRAALSMMEAVQGLVEKQRQAAAARTEQLKEPGKPRRKPIPEPPSPKVKA
jgi:hypothetical protein